MNHRFLVLTAAFVAFSATLFAQGDRKDKTAVTYEELYDEPSSVNKLFVGLQPLYGELSSTNTNAGFRAEVVYYHKDKMDFRAHFRKRIASNSLIWLVTLLLRKVMLKTAQKYSTISRSVLLIT